jgi:hypothetical protein
MNTSLAKIDHSKAMTAAPSWERVSYFADLAAKFQHASTAAQVMAGFDLLDLRKLHGNQGKRTDVIDVSKMSEREFKKALDKVAPDGKAGTSPSNLEKLDWPDAVKKYAGVSDETARSWMKMAEGIRSKWKKLAPQERLQQLMSVAPSEWSEKDTKLVYDSLSKVCDGKTQIDFLRELGLAKKAPGNPNAKGSADKKNLSLSEQTALRKKQAAEDWAAVDRLLLTHRDKFTLLPDGDIEAQIATLELHLKARKEWLKNSVGKRDAKAITEMFNTK